MRVESQEEGEGDVGVKRKNNVQLPAFLMLLGETLEAVNFSPLVF